MHEIEKETLRENLFFVAKNATWKRAPWREKGTWTWDLDQKKKRRRKLETLLCFVRLWSWGMLMHCHPSMEHLWGKFKRQNHCIPLTDTFLINHLNLMVKESTIRYAWIPVRSSFGLTWLGCDLGQTWAEPIPELTPPGSQPLHPLQSPIWKN